VHAQMESYTLHGIEAVPVEVQVACGEGYPITTLVGLPDAAVRESKERILAAFRSTLPAIPPRKTTVNLAPAELRKEGSGFDLPIALSILAAHQIIEPGRLRGVAAIGELSLRGRLHRTRGALAVALAAARNEVRTLLVPRENEAEVSGVEEVEIEPIGSLGEACRFLGVPSEKLHDEMDDDDAPARRVRAQVFCPAPSAVDLSIIRGQQSAKRALEVAAAGGHNLLLVGPPGTGKTLLAQAMAAILPPLSDGEALEITLVQSVAGTLPEGTVRAQVRPFRAPHHTVTPAGLIGGGLYPRPGEVSLAHGGILFLDEVPEFRAGVLDLLRQPLEEGSVRLVRGGRAVRFPCRFSLVAAMNPCPCGFLGHPTKACRCTGRQVQSYQGRVGGPFLDRMDLHVEVPAIGAVSEALVPRRRSLQAESSAAVGDRVGRARKRQHLRFRELPSVECNSQMSLDHLEEFGRLAAGERAFLERAAESLALSPRGIHRTIRVARTIADLADAETVEKEHLAEAVRYRRMDRLRSMGASA